MSRKMRFSILLLLFIIPIANAALFDGWAVDKDTYQVEDMNMIVQPQSDEHLRVTIILGEHLLSVDNGTCEPFEEIYTVCYTDARLYGYDTAEDKEIYEFKIEIKEELAELKITKSIDRILYPNDVGRMTIKIVNSGVIMAEDIVYTESFPGFILGNPQGCNLNGNTIKATYKSLVPDVEKFCSFNIMSETNRTYSDTGTAVYWNGKENVDTQSSSFNLKVLEPELTVHISYDENVSVDEIQTIVFNISNEGENDIVLDKIYLDTHEVEVIEREGWYSSKQGYHIEGTIAPDTQITKNMTIKFQKKGPLNISFTGYYEVLGVSRDFNRTLDFMVNLPEPMIFIRKTNLTLGEDLRLTVSNPNQYIFDDFIVKTIDGNKTDIQTIETIGKKNFKELSIPVTSEHLEFIVIYHSTYGQEFNFTTNATINILTPEEIEMQKGVNNPDGSDDNIQTQLESEKDKTMLKWTLITGLLLVIGILIYIVMED